MYLLATPTDCGSTLLANLLQGLLDSDRAVEFRRNVKKKDFKTNVVIKTHSRKVLNELCKWKIPVQVFLIRRTGAPQYFASKAIVFDYLKFCGNDYDRAIDYVYEKIKHLVPLRAESKQRCLARMVEFDECLKKMTNKSFQVFDPFFHIHGNHRERKTKAPNTSWGGFQNNFSAFILAKK